MGKEHRIYGMAILAEELCYLICDEHDLPSWYSAELFEMTDTIFPSDWHYRYYGYSETGVSAVWGYYELVATAKHFDGINEREPDELVIFIKRSDADIFPDDD